MTPKLPILRRSGDEPGDGLLRAGGLILASGAALALAVVMRLADGPLPVSYTLWVGLSGVIGAWAGLVVSWRDFGWRGASGMFRAIRGGLVFSVTGAVAAGSMVLPVFGTMFAPFAMVVTLCAVPAAAIGLIATITLAHRAVQRWRDRGAVL